MPVPVPVHKRSSTHRVIKSQSTLQAAFQTVATESLCNKSSKYVIKPACKPATLQGQPPSRSHLQGELSCRLASVSCPGDDLRITSRSGLIHESLDFHHGLTTAGDVVISKHEHAEACRSPVSASATLPTSMGLQHFSEQHVLEFARTGYDPDATQYSVDLASRLCERNFDGGGGHYTHGKDAFLSSNSYSCLDSVIAEGPCDSLLHPATTPFADYVDRIVASDGTRASGCLARDAPVSLPPIGASQQQLSLSTEPLSNPTYIRTYRAMAEPLSEWMADYVWKVCADGVGLPRRFVGIGTSKSYGRNPPSSLAKSIHLVLCSTLLQPSAIILALWYITRLPVLFDGQAFGVDLTLPELEFRKELYGEGSVHVASGERKELEAHAPFRIALLGCMLANKWLDDHTFSNKTWQSISDLPIQSINRLELAALTALGHDLSVAPKAWEMWLAQLHRFPAPICRPPANVSHAIARKMIMDLTQLHDGSKASIDPTQPIFSALLVFDFDRKDESCQTGSFDPLEIDLDEDGPLREEYVPKRRSSTLKTELLRRSPCMEWTDMSFSSPLLPPPSEWGPRADPPLCRDTRPYRNYATAPAPRNAPLGYLFPYDRSQIFSWDGQAALDYNGAPFLPDLTEPRSIQPNHGFFSASSGFPISTICPPANHSRTSSSSIGHAAQSSGHIRAHSQAYVGDNNVCCRPLLPCSRYVEQHAFTFPNGQVDACQSRPVWLRA